MDDVTAKWVMNESDKLAVSEGCFFSEKHGERVCRFIEDLCILSKGRWAGKPLKLFDWQRSLVMRMFGWRKADGKRRFRRVYVEVAKKNGKSSLISAIALYMLIFDKEPGAEVYMNACDRDQASIVFDEAARMTLASPELARRTEVIGSRKIIMSGHNKLVANSSDAMKQDGLNCSCSIFDELHRQADNSLWEVMEYAGAAREQQMQISITTAGEDEEGIWFQQREFSEQVEAGIVPVTWHLGVIFRALEEDDIQDENTWRKANPSLGQTVSVEDFRHELEEAMLVPAKLGNFKRLRLNIVSRGGGKFVEMADWDQCNADPVLDPSEPCYLGLDLSSRNDLTALVLVQGSLSKGINVFCRFWLPRDGIAQLERMHQVPYREWSQPAVEGQPAMITLTAGTAIDYEFVMTAIVELSEKCNVVKLMADPYNGKKLCEDLTNKHGLPVKYLRQGYLSLSDPTKTLAELISAHKIRHGGNDILRWHASNCIAEQDAAGNLKLSKGKSRHKIDGMSALVDAVAGLLDTPEDEEFDGHIIL